MLPAPGRFRTRKEIEIPASFQRTIGPGTANEAVTDAEVAVGHAATTVAVAADTSEPAARLRRSTQSGQAAPGPAGAGLRKAISVKRQQAARSQAKPSPRIMARSSCLSARPGLPPVFHRKAPTNCLACHTRSSNGRRTLLGFSDESSQLPGDVLKAQSAWGISPSAKS
jgi:hypothetical protein